MICAGCRLEVIGGWEAGDGRIFCAACIREQVATADTYQLNEAIRTAAMLQAQAEVRATEPPSRAERLVRRIHELAHAEPVEDCPDCE